MVQQSLCQELHFFSNNKFNVVIGKNFLDSSEVIFERKILYVGPLDFWIQRMDRLTGKTFFL